MRPQIRNRLIPLLRIRRLLPRKHVDDAKPHGTRLGGAPQQRAHHSTPPIRQHRRPIANKMLPEARNLLPTLLRAVHEQPSIAQQMVAYRPEVVSRAEIQGRGSVQGGDEVPLEEIGACGEGDRVRDRGFEDGGVVLEEGEGLGDGGHGGVRYCFYEGFDGGDGHGEVRVGGEDRAVGGDDVEGGEGLFGGGRGVAHFGGGGGGGGGGGRVDGWEERVGGRERAVW
ncbi:hypothetical protein GRF29_154g1366900 [Pseudopithomyces chartarum]|uniref:Uncharacterized protein n=1 Tax=Pseudopithomyces chartarum TaxID=1892770 RepID=A0AAN6LR43_9PLEO|nr:hypothetical protein GRF29_154g1366900 [Pseudopithomyces chartarum]